MKQRIASVLLCFGLLFCLTACGGGAEEAAVQPASAEPVQEPSVEPGEAVNGAVMRDVTVNISVIYPENTPEEEKGQYGLIRLDGDYAPLDATVYGDGESLAVTAGELCRFMPAPVGELLPAIIRSAGGVLGQELDGQIYITINDPLDGVMNVTVDYTNESTIGRIQSPPPASEEADAAAQKAIEEASEEAGTASIESISRPCTVSFKGFFYPDGHDAASDSGGIRVYEEPGNWSVYTDYTETVTFELGAGEELCYSLLPTRANTAVSGRGNWGTAVTTDDLPRNVIDYDTEIEIHYEEPGPICLGPAREDLRFTVEVIYPEGVAEEDKEKYGLQQLDCGMNPMESRVYGDGDVFTVPYAYWAGFVPLQPELAELRYTEAAAYDISGGTVFRSAENGEVTVTVDYSGE